MSLNSPILFVEINNYNLVFSVGDVDENENFILLETIKIPIIGIDDKKIINPTLIQNAIKENIYLIEKKLDFIFKDVILLINNFNQSIINFSGFKNLNGSQLSKDNITYILNSLKSKISEVEDKKMIIHIFNTKYILDKKSMDNLPVGLFGNFYSQELSFCLIEKNDYKNLENIFLKCNLKIKKIIFKDFLKGIDIINSNLSSETFFKININETDTEIIFFENSALKFTQNFKFGSNIILSDISKIIALDREIVKKILSNISFSTKTLDKEFIEEKFFKNQNFRKIKKKLIYDIAQARIDEIADIAILNNINTRNFLIENLKIFLTINDKLILKCFEQSFRNIFSKKNKIDLIFFEDIKHEEIYRSANNLVQYGWRREAVPIIHEKKTIISRIFNLFFK